MFNRIVCFSLLSIACFGSGMTLSPLTAEGTVIQVIDSSEKGFSSENIEGAKASLKKWAKANKDIMQQFDLFVKSLQKGVDEGALTSTEAKKILTAVSFAAEKHKLQLRTNTEKTPYIIHPLGVTEQLMRIGHVYDVDVLVAALLHDVLDDTGTTVQEISGYFGDKVAAYVQEVTGDMKLSSKERKKMQIIHAFNQSKGATFIKLSDKLHNLNTLMQDPPAGWSQERMDQYFQWAQAVVDNLPDVNKPLKEEVHKTIARYWNAQGK